MMNPSEILRIVDAIHREKNINKEIVFQAMEAALVSAAKRHYGEEEDIVIAHQSRGRRASPAPTTASPWPRRKSPSGSPLRPPSR